VLVLKTCHRNYFCAPIIFLTPIAGFWLIILRSILMALSTQSILFIWVRLEINIIAVLPLLASGDSFFSSELRIKYFISQTIASVFFLGAYLMLLIFSSTAINLLCGVFILFKLGVPPFHRWLRRIVITGPYLRLWLVLFVQKFIPLQFLSNLNLSSLSMNMALILLAFLCVSLVKSISDVRIIILVSAWVNTSWMILSSVRINI